MLNIVKFALFCILFFIIAFLFLGAFSLLANVIYNIIFFNWNYAIFSLFGAFFGFMCAGFLLNILGV